MVQERQNLLGRLLGLFIHQKVEQNLGLIQDMRTSMTNLSLKASMLNDSYMEEKAQIRSLVEEANALVPLKNILAAKFEQDILGKITEVSSACDGVLATGQDGQFRQQLSALESLVKQRKVIKNERDRQGI